MTNKLISVENVITDLFSRNENKLAYELLEFYYKSAKNIDEFELIGKLSLKYYYPKLSVQCAEKVYSMVKTPDQLYVARINLHKAYLAANYPEKALFYNFINLTLRPNEFESIVSYAAALKFNGQRDESEEIINKLYTTNISEDQKRSLEITQTHKNLRQGNVAKGIELFLRDDKKKYTIFDILGMNKWNGVKQPGKTLYVYDQGGYGDAFINLRFFNHIKKFGMNPILFTLLERDDIAKIYRRMGYDVITKDFLVDTKSTWTNLLELPIDLDLSEKDLWDKPYLSAIQNSNNKLKSKKFKIGIKVNGNQYFAQDIYRSIPIEQMLDIIPKNCEVYYFDKDKTHNLTISLKDKLNTWDDTLDYINQMDLIVSSCTSLVHAAGALGKTTIVITPISEYYIWTSTRKDTSTPWYGDNFYVCKQKKIRDWTEPLNQAKEIINKYYNNYDKKNISHDNRIT